MIVLRARMEGDDWIVGDVMEELERFPIRLTRKLQRS